MLAWESIWAMNVVVVSFLQKSLKTIFFFSALTYEIPKKEIRCQNGRQKYLENRVRAHLKPVSIDTKIYDT
jgi:hypothetical protein